MDSFIYKAEDGSSKTLMKDRGDTYWSENIYTGIPSNKLTVGYSTTDATLATVVSNVNTYLAGSSNDFHSVQLTSTGALYVAIVLEYT